MENVVLFGKLSVVGTCFSRDTGEIRFIGNLRVGDKVYDQAPFLRLVVMNYGDESECEVEVDDEYCPFLPYLKPIAYFRHCFLKRLVPVAVKTDSVSSSELLRQGLIKYVADLRKFSNDESIVRQAKTAVNILNSKRGDSVKKARAVLEALGKKPSTETPFLME